MTQYVTSCMTQNVGAIFWQKRQKRVYDTKVYDTKCTTVSNAYVLKKSKLDFQLKALTSKFDLFSVVIVVEYCHWIVHVSLHFGSMSHENQFVNRSRQRTTMVGSL